MSSWFGSSNSTVELDNKISEATSESIPNGEIDLGLSLEITDLIRSKKYQPKQCMKALKKRVSLIYSNPNLLTSSLKLTDLCIKNSGYAFLVEISSKEFIDYLVDFIFKLHYNTKDEEGNKVGVLILSLIKNWSKLFKNQVQLIYVEKKYNELRNEGYEFDSFEDEIANLDISDSKFIDSEVAPDWIDSDSCMICYNPFSMLNRKHHCRACGGVYCQTHSNNNIPLVNLGIMEPVRVCDTCFAKQKYNKKSEARKSTTSRSHVNVEDEDEQLKRAIELSLKDSGSNSVPKREVTPPPPPPQPKQANEDEEDEEMKAALAASLREYESQKQQQQPVQEEPQDEEDSDAYNIKFPIFNQQQDSYPQQFQQQQQQQQQQNPFEQERVQESISRFQSPTQVEDLSQSEEEQINLFITLMNNVKSDPKKSDGIMYDKNLNELYLKIIKLKPKLNKSLKNSIEKYQSFIQLNNKMNLINNLYNKFLDNTILQQQQEYDYGYNSYNYNNNAISQQSTGYQQSSTSYPPISQQSTGYKRQAANQYQSNSYQQQEMSTNYPLSQQSTGYEQNYESASSPQHIARLPTGYISGQGTGYPKQEKLQQLQQQPTYPTSLSQQSTGISTTQPNEYNNDYPPTSQQHTGYQYQSSPLKQQSNPYPINLQPSEPDFEDEVEEQNNNNYQSSEQLSNVPFNNPEMVRRVSSTLPPNAVENASLKFPTLNDVEQDYERNKNKHLSDLPRLPNNLQQFEHDEPERKEPEPEPLIDL
ncbi:unnamed protein product [Candida verbasci]|uniref:Vacuolar protein sorting-associated protein 27 n=1 Tax=Candida verbasci TaxID=1227364 RepID=A0A9W4TZT7_9ASCO|nr:unnamed protein product [Candida verbasci]